MMKIINRALDGYARFSSAFFSSKWTVLLFSLVPLVAAPQALWALLRGDVVTFVGWLSSNYWQLVALPVLAYEAKLGAEGRQVLHKKVDALHAKADAIHEKVSADDEATI